MHETWALPPLQRLLRVVARHALERVDELPRFASRLGIRDHVVLELDVVDIVVDGSVVVRVHVRLDVALVLLVHGLHQVPPQRHHLLEVSVVQHVRRPHRLVRLAVLIRDVGARARVPARADRALIEPAEERRAEAVLLRHGPAWLHHVRHVLQPRLVPVDDLEGALGGVLGALRQRLEEELVGVQDCYGTLVDVAALSVQPVLEGPRLVEPRELLCLRDRGRDVHLDPWVTGFQQVGAIDQFVRGATLVCPDLLFHVLVAPHHDASDAPALTLVVRRVQQHLCLPVLEGVASRREHDVHVVVRGRAVLSVHTAHGCHIVPAQCRGCRQEPCPVHDQAAHSRQRREQAGRLRH
mmetsp:Transcript_86158/g.224758  ORF Transcript_86158/g.224758 Transcript_86158/m.224758 type:complete len:353 (-) Transcript_86158:86-1144(-)